MSAFLKYFTVAFAASNQFTAVAGLGCEASCDGSSGQLTFEGVEDLILDGAMPVGLGNELASARKGVADLDNSLDKKADEAGDAVGDALHTKGKELTDALDLKLYSQLTGKINQNRLLIQGERQAIARHLGCGAAGFVWDDEDKSCMPLRVHTCGPLGGSPATRTVQENLYWDNRAKTEADCHGITGTECRTRCLPGWSGEEVTYICTDSGSWKRIPSHGNRDQTCYNVDECSLPDYPCPDKTYQCTDTDGSYSCGCPFRMEEFGNTCDCPNDSYWRVSKVDSSDPHQLTAYCTCPFGGDVNMEVDSAGRCDCPSYAPEKELHSYPTAPYVFGVENQNDDNKNYHCSPPPPPPPPACTPGGSPAPCSSSCTNSWRLWPGPYSCSQLSSWGYCSRWGDLRSWGYNSDTGVSITEGCSHCGQC